LILVNKAKLHASYKELEKEYSHLQHVLQKSHANGDRLKQEFFAARAKKSEIEGKLSQMASILTSS